MNDDVKKKLEERIVGLVKEYVGKKRFKPVDLVKEMEKEFSADNLSKEEIKKALKEVMDEGRLVYGYAGGSFLTIPEEG